MVVKIAVVGAGPAGLICARIMNVSDQDIEVTVFERDATPTSRTFRGGSLDMHQDSGLLAIRKAGLYDKAKDMLRYDGEEITLSDKHGTTVFHMKEPPRQTLEEYERPEIDREMLKELLLDSIGKDKVQWGKILETADEVERTLTFRDGTTAGPFDLIVGADGAFSKVRPLLTDVKPVYSGCCGFEAYVANPDGKHPNLAKRVGDGSFFSYSDHKTITSLRVYDRSLKVDIFWQIKDKDFAHKLWSKYSSDPEKLKAEILEDFKDWVPEVQEFITACKILRPVTLWELPVGTTWDHKEGFTMIGDAASLMTPFSGEGANKALNDGLHLAEAIIGAVKSGESLDRAVAAYEHDMFIRSLVVQKRTMQNKTRILGSSRWGASWWLVDVGSYVLEDLGYPLDKGWRSLLPIMPVAFLYFALVQLLGEIRRRTKDVFIRH
ncbi:hypothetical protein NW767_010794 [Fusarium falciforme]|uniref:FAD-binding domain-containing protein n=1 Tax=Fusarium falciforme TaxID=195108 RepID=A0A9W8R3G6_9HYPO|nr:hypothetical protein NW755_007873 [Fusarium falciforme]KAJ4191887.1 hypothetical protein NW767_010794 [Fusarium falciforme]